VPVRVADVGRVSLGAGMRRGVLDLNGEREVVGGVVIMRQGENALNVIDRIKAKLDDLRPSLPEGMEVVVTYDRSGLIHRAIQTLTHELVGALVVVAVSALVLGVDPWLINPLFATCGEIDIHATDGGECLRNHVDALLTKIRRKYKEYGINEKPFVVVKADNGTYGMGIMTVRDVKDLDALNRKTKNKMAVIKDGQEVHDVIIQEGVLTNERVHDAVAETKPSKKSLHSIG